LYKDRLTYPALKLVQSRILSPVIIKARRHQVRMVLDHIVPFVDEMQRTFPRLQRPELLSVTPLLKVIQRFHLVSAYLPREVIFSLAESPSVERIYPDQLMYAFQFPVVPAEGVYTTTHRIKKEMTFTTTYWVKKIIGADMANEKGFFGQDILACVIDTGASRVHEQLRGIDFESTIPGQYRDENGHGSWCTACVGGVRGIDGYLSRKTGRQVVCEGMAPYCRLLAVKSLGFLIGVGSTSNIIEGIDIALQKGSDIISMSLGGPSETDIPEDDPYLDVFEEVLRYETIPIVAAGNEGDASNTVSSPGCLPNVLCVGAYDPITGKVADFSSRGPTNWGDIRPDVCMPGVMMNSGCVGLCDIAGDGVPSRYSTLSGTSMATPTAAGLVVLMRECHNKILGKTLTLDEIKAMMEQLGKEKDNDSGWGVMTWQLYEHWLSTQYSVELR